MACAAALAAGAGPALAADADFRWDGRQFVSEGGGFSIKPKGRLLLDVTATDGSRFEERNLSGDEVRAFRMGVEGMVGQHLYYTAEGDFAGGTAILRSTYLAWRDRLGGKEVELTVGNRLSERGVEGSSSSDGAPFMERNVVATAIAPLKGFYGWGVIGKVYGGDWHVAAQVAGDDPGNRGAARDTVSYLLRAHWNPVKSKAGFAHVGAWTFYEEYPDDLASLSRNTNMANHYNSHVQAPLGTVVDPRHGAGYGLELGGGRGPLWSFLEVGRRSIDARTDHVDVDAVALTAGWLLNGAANAYSPRGGTFVRIKPNAPVSKGGWGDWEIAARYQILDNTDAPLGGRGEEAEIGVNWRVEEWMRLMVNLSHWQVEHRAGKYLGVDDGSSVAGRLQVSF